MPTKTDNSKLLHFLESHIEPTIDWPSCAAYITDGDVILQSLIIFLSRISIQPVTKGIVVCYHHIYIHVNTLYKQQPIKSYKRSCRGTAPTFLLSGAKSRTPRDWKSFMTNYKNRIKLISLLLDQLTNDKYATKLRNGNISYVILK